MKLFVAVLVVSLLFVAGNAQPVALSTENAGDGSKQPDAALEMLQDMGDVEPFPTLVSFDSTSLDSFICTIMARWHIPGAATWVSKNGQVIWQQCFGYANLEDSIPVADTTLFMLASESKLFTATAIMQLWERGEFDLDDDVNDYLPFDVRNPNFPDIPITFRMIMTHTSSINDDMALLNSLYVSGGDSPIPLGGFLEDYLVPGGVYYDPAANFNAWQPGLEYDYSNVAIALLGYLVEAIEDSFPIHCQDSIFTPLGMNETSWFLAGLNTNNIAVPYDWFYEPYPHYGYPDYPSGQLRTSVVQLARHLTALMQYGMIDSVRILDSTTVDLMRTVQYQIDRNWWMGLVWHYKKIRSRWLWGHGGADYGVSTVTALCPPESSAVIILTNGSNCTSGKWAIMDALFDYAKNYSSCASEYYPEIVSESGVQEGMSGSCETQVSFPTIFRGPLQLPKNAGYKVFDISGRVVMPEMMKPGIYFIGIDDRIIQKVIKVR